MKLSKSITDRICEEITKNQDHISFARFMEWALYDPALGFYTSKTSVGAGGHFITAPEISPLFAACIAKSFQTLLSQIEKADFLEIGAGTGQFAKDLLFELEKTNSLPEHYFIYEISPALKHQQQQLLQASLPQFYSRIHWLDVFPQNFRGMIFANEVLDAMPFHCFSIDDGHIKERYVTFENNQLEWTNQLSQNKVLTQQVTFLQENYGLTDGYTSEIHLHHDQWIQNIAQTLEQGLILLFDYGYGRREYYHPDRTCGTLMCYFQHQRHSNPFVNVGLQDITAHVDFTTIAESAVNSDLKVAGYTTQAAFLLANDIMTIAEKKNLSEKERFQQNQAIKKMIMPSQMGEAIKVMGLTKNLHMPFTGFNLQDRRGDLTP